MLNKSLPSHICFHPHPLSLSLSLLHVHGIVFIFLKTTTTFQFFSACPFYSFGIFFSPMFLLLEFLFHFIIFRFTPVVPKNIEIIEPEGWKRWLSKWHLMEMDVELICLISFFPPLFFFTSSMYRSVSPVLSQPFFDTTFLLTHSCFTVHCDFAEICLTSHFLWNAIFLVSAFAYK